MIDGSGSDPELKVQPDQSLLKKIVRERFAQFLRSGESVEHVTMTDMDPEGKYRNGYLVITDSRVFTGYLPQDEENDEGLFQKQKPDPIQPELAFNHTEIEDMELEHFTGNGLITLRTAEKTYKLVRFSLTFAGDFDEAAAKIVEMAIEDGDEKKKEILSGYREDDNNKKRCPECGTLLKSGVCPNCLDKGSLLRRLLRYLIPYKSHVIASSLLLLATSALSLVQPYLTGVLVDEVLISEDLVGLRNLVIILGLVHLSSSGISGIRTYIMTKMGQGIIRDMRSQVFQHLQYLNMRFFDSVRTGAIMSRTTSDTRQLQRFITQSTQRLLRRSVELVAVGIMLFNYDVLLATFTLAPMPLIVLATRLFSNKVHHIYHRVWVRRALMNSVVADAIPGIKVVKSFAQEEQEIDKFDHHSDQVYQQRVNVGKFRSMFRPFLRFSTSLGTLIIWGYGGYLAIATPRLSVGDVVAFLYYVNRFYNPLRQLFEFSDVIQEAATAASRVFEILDTEPEVKGGEDKHKLEDIEGQIKFDDVSFAYEAHEPVLKNVSFTIEPGQMVGLVGSSGGGKSTLVNLIPRLYDVTSGKVMIDGHDVRNLDLKVLRDNIGIVLQDPILFHGTIAENIRYGLPEASLEDVVWAAQAANAHDFIMEFPDGYDTHTGERGLRLSGGQKQRISIARALLKNPKILILDEATSSVDTETERLIQEAIDRLVQNRTTIAIAHRLSTLKNADHLLVLEEGEIVEEGTHEELIEADGVFAKLLRMQSRAAEMQAI